MKKQKKVIRKSSATANVPARALLSLVASRLKDRDLFPRKTIEAKEFLDKLKSAKD